MKEELNAAAKWIASNMSQRNMTPEQLASFETNLIALLSLKFAGHWYEAQPMRGQAFRAVIASEDSMDAALLLAAQQSGVVDMQTRMRKNWSMWIDPGEVEVRDDETHQSIKLYPKPALGSSLLNPNSPSFTSQKYPDLENVPLSVSIPSTKTGYSEYPASGIPSKRAQRTAEAPVYYDYVNQSPQQPAKVILRRPSTPMLHGQSPLQRTVGAQKSKKESSSNSKKLSWRAPSPRGTSISSRA